MNKLPQTLDPEVQIRINQAECPATAPEILQKLAADPVLEVRLKVAENTAAPIKANVLLALDSSNQVRAAIAHRADTMVGKLAQVGIPHAAALVMHTLEVLALDQAVNVRIALASSLKDIAFAPPALIRRLAQDITREVAEPILRCCLALSDADLIALIAQRQESWSRQAIAARPRVSSQVSDAIIASNDSSAIVTLLSNQHAQLDEHRLTLLTERATSEKAWQEPLAMRHGLPPKLARRLAEFVEEKVLGMLRQRQDFDTATMEDIITTVRRRVAWTSAPNAALPGPEKAHKLFLSGSLGETQISDALSWNEQDFVRHALALLAQMPETIVADILKSQSPRAVTALAWRAKLSMRCALLLQMRAADIPTNRLLNARGGTDFPLTEVDMLWQLEMYGVHIN